MFDTSEKYGRAVFRPQSCYLYVELGNLVIVRCVRFCAGGHKVGIRFKHALIDFHPSGGLSLSRCCGEAVAHRPDCASASGAGSSIARGTVPLTLTVSLMLRS